MLTIILIWAAFGVVNYGLVFGSRQREYQAIAEDQVGVDQLVAGIAAVFGPLGSIWIWRCGFYKHGIMYSSKPENRFAATLEGSNRGNSGLLDTRVFEQGIVEEART